MHSNKKYTLFYVVIDGIVAAVSWAIYFIWRKITVTPWMSVHDMILDLNFAIGVVVIPIIWLLWFTLMGSYTPIYRRSRLYVFYETIVTVFIGCIAILFFILSDDDTLDYISYVKSFLILLVIHLSLFLFFRLSYLTIIGSLVRNGVIKFKTLVIKSNDQCLKNLKKKCNHPIIEVEDFSDLADTKYDFEEIFLCRGDIELRKKLLNQSYKFPENCVIKIPADDYDDLIDTDRLSYDIHGDVFVIQVDYLPTWQKNIKRTLDIVLSFLAIIILLPIIIIIALIVQISSPGGVIFSQERIGKNADPFFIYKFRSMYEESEIDGPVLSYKGDARCTPFGRVMRKFRLDEIPQFLNVIKGEMSIVGPRPERKYYIDQLMKHTDQFGRLFTVRPGITSWGQVRYGYASNLSEMIKRLRFDLLYIDNRSLWLDFKIMLYTVLVLIRGEGK